MSELERWFGEQLMEHKVEPNSGLGHAITYMRKHWKKLNHLAGLAGTVFSFFIFMTYHFIETIQASSEIGVVLCICLQFLYRHGDSRGSSFVSARYLSRSELGVFPESE